MKKGGAVKRQTGGPARRNLLEEVGRIDAERMNPNRRAEKRRVIGELNRGYQKGGRVGAPRKKKQIRFGKQSLAQTRLAQKRKHHS